MVIFRLLELVMAFLTLWFIVSQVLLPAVRGTMLFPWFRSSEREQILRGEGEAARKRAVMMADGALDKKLEAYKVVQGYWANAFKDFGGTMVPQVQMGAGGGNNSAVGAQNLMELLTAKTAKDLALDLSNTGKGATAQ